MTKLEECKAVWNSLKPRERIEIVKVAFPTGTRAIDDAINFSWSGLTPFERKVICKVMKRLGL